MASGSSVPPMRLSLKSLHTLPWHYDSSGQERLLRMMVGAYMYSSCGSIASTFRLPLMALLGMLLHTNRVGVSTEMKMQVQGSGDWLANAAHVQYISVMRPLHDSIASPLGSGPTTSVKLREPLVGTATLHSALVLGQSLAQLQLHVPPSLVLIAIASTPDGPSSMRGMQTLASAAARTCGRRSGRSPRVPHTGGTGRGCSNQPHGRHKALALQRLVGGEDDRHRASTRSDRWWQVAIHAVERCNQWRRRVRAVINTKRIPLCL